jgi:hypothetical protein
VLKASQFIQVIRPADISLCLSFDIEAAIAVMGLPINAYGMRLGEFVHRTSPA